MTHLGNKFRYYGIPALGALIVIAIAAGLFALLEPEIQALAQNASSNSGSSDPSSSQRPSRRPATPPARPQQPAQQQTQPAADTSKPGASSTPFEAHVDQAKLKTCAGTFSELGKAAAASDEYMAMSQWSQQQADAHSIQSIVGMAFKSDSTLSSGASIVFAAPVQGGCEGNLVRVVPSTQPCNLAVQSLGLANEQAVKLVNVPIATTKAGANVIFLSNAGGCVIVTVARGAQAKN
ncbi:hypothetical protein [Bosea sp. (in: a-proteobacteria)]|jgi:hypothetical protein|uniref:hypothetical protein n=1 Tax=Bosea sp. (in: a-proteobacteria) TaxID=1871050 RepID=UPI002DDCEF84|nr:hypothetical protein [Bosea sp. (in: a-proteobacteria)]HEV2512621.1 hypothetical protein [Bosea sp. (in: a-proteobacteria)]